MVKFVTPTNVTKVVTRKWGGPEGESVTVADVRPGQEILPAEIYTGEKPKHTRGGGAESRMTITSQKIHKVEIGGNGSSDQ